MKRLTTASGSIYELDSDNRRVRRLFGAKAPTARQGEDGEWKTYVAANICPASAVEKALGREYGPLLITWSFDEDKEHDMVWGRSTMTSRVVKVEEVTAEVVDVADVAKEGA